MVNGIRVLWVSATLIFLWFLFSGNEGSPELEIRDALYLTKNSLREIKSKCWDWIQHQIVPRRVCWKDAKSSRDNIDSQGFEKKDTLRQKSPANSLDNLLYAFFPIDAMILYNRTTSEGDRETWNIRARYASFSSIVNNDLEGEIAIAASDFCETLDNITNIRDKILVLSRGGCTFSEKITNVLNLKARPKSVIVANNKPNDPLITMYSSSLEQRVHFPVMFITYESYNDYLAQANGKRVSITTLTYSNLVNILGSSVLSPPLIIILVYLSLKCSNNIKRKKKFRQNLNLVRRMPVYVFNGDHLVPKKSFASYLEVTDLTHKAQEVDAVSNDSSPTESVRSFVLKDHVPNLETSRMSPYANNKDLIKLKKDLGLLLAPEDYYHSLKCSICLERFHRLSSHVIVLSCRHIFHESCLSNWLINFKRCCPLCKSAINSKYIPLLSDNAVNNDYGSINANLESQMGSSMALSD
ncbi:Piso0_002708 [Millerozyma farinosa CBS 7064]|uniref:Piso0_002708 protein n=1 Tax=Pichia sorbitophila (strain ATCC MYA-4447 / BCRC 22081 / CBS 7064 / NBRC 10061 / NRRL Y-12695) TaxID=559304 RepID=G8YDB1_PICSO|nr:Piso0_002708 [Millerozyma farinosa CBS 7064]